ncbi:MAG: hypothetical protein HYZ17_17865 [Betaproteobacteria bacterium]|nr:hypothetical protein [Betaproteobacteria bacterium]
MLDYAELEFRIQDAKRLRDQAVAEMFLRAGRGLRQAFARAGARLMELAGPRHERGAGLPEALNPYRSISRKSLSTVFP